MKKSFVIATMLCALGGMYAHAQRQISSFKEIRIVSGNTSTIGGEKRTEPDIYYIPQEDGTYQAARLTVAPKDAPAEVTVPYLNMNTPESICVNWKTSKKETGAIVRFGTSPDNLDSSCEPAVRSISSNYFWHTAKLTGLRPNTVYYYQVSTNGTDSEIYRFRTMPQAGDKAKMRILLIGDHQRNERSDYEWMLNAARQTVKEKYGDGPFEDYISFLLNDGDQVDYGGDLNLYEKVHLYKSRSVSPTLSNMTAVGNHEYKGDDRLYNYDGHFREYGNLEYQGIKSGTSGYYAYQTGSVLFVVLNSDDPSVAQKMWVRKVIAAASVDPSVEFVVSVQHRPLYAEQYAGDVSQWMLDEIMPILSSTPKHVLNCAGHHHLYARGQMTDSPVYHIITGGGVGTSAEGYEQLWGKTPDNFNHDEVQKTIDHWTYQILEFDPETRTMTVDCYSIGNSRLALDNELVDTFTRTIDAGEIPARPVIAPVDETVTLPYTFTQSTADAASPYAVRYQIASDAEFKSTVIDKVINAEDFYGATEDFRPLDINKDLDLKKFTVENGDLPNGTYYIRVCNRNANIEWSEFSEPVKFAVEGAGDPATVDLGGRFFHTGTQLHLTYGGAPLNTDAWVGIYKEHYTPGTSDTSDLYEYTKDASGSWDFTINTPGAYFAVLFKDGGYTEISPRAYFVVSDNCDDSATPSVSTDKFVYEVGDPIVVQLENAPCISKDWVGIYTSTVAVVKNGKSHSYAYAGSDPMGTVTLNVSGNFNYTTPVSDGLYYATYCIADQYYEPVERSYFIVGKPVLLETEKKGYHSGDEVRFVYEGTPAWDGVTLSVYSGETLIADIPVADNGGVVGFEAPAEGVYEACIRTADGKEISPRIGFTVEKAVIDAWMSRLEDNAYLHQVSIPGTHDAATGNGTTMDSFARTQELSLVGQFEAGIRAFDLRPSVSDGILKIYHGIVETKVTFDEALSAICEQLDNYPTEFAVVVMRHEDDHESASDKELWNGLVEQTLADEKYAGRFVDFTNTLTVADVRGKILLLSRDKYATKPVGGFITGWTHSADFSEQGNGRVTGTNSRAYARLHVQDFYETRNAMDKKLSAISNLLDHSVKLNTSSSHNWVINHTSGYSQTGLFATADAYRLNAASTNIAVVDYLSDEANAGPAGLVMMDYAGVDRSGDYDVNGHKLVDAVIGNNFRYTMRGKSSGVEDVAVSSEDDIAIVANGEVRANGLIEVYTTGGVLYATGYGKISVTAPGIYIVRTAGAACKMVVR